jgi:cytochrome oxidase Cu insertion factor (SCO1/SenC/PrrC family)
MNRKSQLILIYTVVVVASVLMITSFLRIGAGVPTADLPLVSDAGKEETGPLFTIERDIKLTNQVGEEVRLTEDLRGKVTVLAEFFAVCPHCAVRNGKELVEIYKQFGDHPDFQIVCISVDPETDAVPQLKAYGDALGADPGNWWFASGESEEEVHRYLEEELKFFKIRRWVNEVDIASNGRFSHDMDFYVIDRDLQALGKWPLVGARSEEESKRDPGRYGREKLDMFETIEEELAKP